MKTWFKPVLLAALSLSLLSSCGDDDDIIGPTVVKTWNLTLSAKNEVPAVAGSSATGTAKLSLLSNNSLKYEFTVNNLASGDVLTMSHLHVGDAGSTGPVVLPLAMSFTSNSASGTVSDLRTSLVDSLKSDANEIYFNVHSQQAASGIVRAQLNTNVELAMDVALSSNNEVTTTPIVPTATGTAILRMTSAKKLYSKVTVTGLAPGDQLTMAHIHTGATGTNGPVYVTLCGSNADFGVVKTNALTDEQYGKIKTDPMYVNAHSNVYPTPGVARGQIR